MGGRGVRSVATGWTGRLGLPRLSQCRVDSFDLLIIAVSALGAGLALARTLPYGVGLNHDSLNYIEVARNVLAGEGFADYDGTIHTIWPPGYPLLLAGASLGIVDPRDVAGPLNAVLFGLTILVVGLYLRRRLESRFLALWACLAIALALPLVDLARFAMSGMPFILFATLALIQTDRALRDDGRSALVWAAVFCALAWQMRYVGAAVPALTGMALLLQGGMPPMRRLRRAALFAAVAGAPMALWMLRNYIAVGLVVPHGGVDLSLTDILRDGARILASWGQPLSGWFAVIVFAALMLSLGVVIARGSGACARRACLIFGGFGLAYAALISAAIALGYQVYGIHPRFVAPLYIPLVALATFALDGLFGWERDRRAAGSAGRPPTIRTFVWGIFRLDRLLAIALGVGLCAWIALQAIANADHLARANAGELYMAYGGPRWLESETLRYARERLSGAVIYTNLPLQAHFHSDGNAAYIKLSETLPDPMQVAHWVARNDGAYVVWLYDRNPEMEFRPMNMRVLEGVEPVVEFADGEVFRLNGEYKPNPGANPWLAAYEAIATGEATRLSSGAKFEVYVHEDALVYFKSPCEAADTRDPFFLHIFTEVEYDLPDERMPYRFDNLDFEFEPRGALFGDNCVGLTPLPRYESERIRTGQHVIGKGARAVALWEANMAGTVALRYRQAHKAAIGGDYGGAAARSNFDLYLNEDAESGTLVYVKEPCAADDTQARFFLHIFPEDESYLLAESKPHGFANLDFQFADYGVELDGICVAMRGLPQYEIERIITGQHVSGEGALWKARVAVSAGRRYRQAHKAAMDGDYGGAAAQSKFDVYLDDDAENKTLVYVKERCGAEDTRARFFLHIIPSDEADLPAERKPSGFDNMDFRFADYGLHWGGICVALRELPEYEIERVRTGQHVGGEGAVWRVEFGVDGRE